MFVTDLLFKELLLFLMILSDTSLCKSTRLILMLVFVDYLSKSVFDIRNLAFRRGLCEDFLAWWLRHQRIILY